MLNGSSQLPFLKGGITASMVYYASFKLTDDVIEGLPGIFVPGKNKVFAIGPEVTIALASKTKVFGDVSVPIVSGADDVSDRFQNSNFTY